jgi:mannose-6-phosphate isomerase-like protein (cupin superfamily)
MSNHDNQKDEPIKSITKRPWGEFEILGRFFLDEPGSKNEIIIKRISVNPGGKLSLQSHTQRSEQWNVVSGEGEFIIGEKKISVKAGDCAYVPQGEKHRMINSDNAKLFMVVEVSRGLFNEDDVIRYEDDYGRA